MKNSSLTVAILCAFSLISSKAAEERLTINYAPLNQLVLRWQPAVSNTYYRLLYNDDLTSSNGWRTAWTGFVTNGTVSRSMFHTNQQRYFKLERSTNLLDRFKLFVDPYSAAKAQVDAWTNSRPADAAMLNRVATNSAFRWLSREPDVEIIVSNQIYMAEQSGSVACFVVFDLPLTGETNWLRFLDWMSDIRDGIGSKPAIVVLEPNSIAGMIDLDPTLQEERVIGLKRAISLLRQLPECIVYLDGGHPDWKPVTEMTDALKRVGIENAHGFALNTANFVENSRLIQYGTELSQNLNNIHFIVDTSRNGRGPASNGEWCNPPDRALGSRPTVNIMYPLIDGAFWIKPPGESDGTCNGGPSAGTFWPEYALGLAQRALW